MVVVCVVVDGPVVVEVVDCVVDVVGVVVEVVEVLVVVVALNYIF